MKEGWEIKRLGDIFKTAAGGTPLKIHKEYYEGGDIPWLLSGEVSQAEILTSRNFITKKGLKNSSAKLFPPDTVLVAMYGATAGNAATNQAICGVLPNNRALPKFIYFYFLLIKDVLVSKATGNAQPNISQIKIKNMQIPLPPLPEQKRIVKILDRAFAAIDKAKANTKKNLKNCKELFDSFLNNIFSNPGEDWEEKKLGGISIDFGRGKSKHRPRNYKKLFNGIYPFIQTGDIRNSNHLISKYTQTYNDAGLAQSKLWPKGTLCITIAANIAETGILNFDACFPDSIIGLVADNQKANIDFIEFLLQAFKAKLQSKGKGSAQDNINLGTFANEVFPIPKLSKQDKIVSKLNILSEKIKYLETKYLLNIAALEELKKSILQKAFEGEL